MFLRPRIKQLIFSFNKAFRFILITFFIAGISSIIAVRANAKIEDDKVRKAVINQLIILNGKPKHKDEISDKKTNKTNKTKQDTQKSANKVTKQPIVTPAKNSSQKAILKKQKKNPSQANKTSHKKSNNTPKNTKRTKSTKSTKTVNNKAIKGQTTPLVEVLTNEEIQAVMQDVMQSPNEKTKINPTASKPAQSKGQTKQQTEQRIKPQTAAEQKPVNPTKAQSIPVGRTQLGNKASDTLNKPQALPPKTVATQKAEKSIPQTIPVGRTQGKQITTTPTQEPPTGWIYLGHFAKNKWESQTLDIEKQLPEIGKYYAISATMVNIRAALPKKGVMGKAIKAVRQKAEVKILQLRGLGRNRQHYWAKIEY